MDGRPIWTDRDEAGDYVVPKVLSPRDLVSRPDNMDETVPHTHTQYPFLTKFKHFFSGLNLSGDIHIQCMLLFYIIIL